MLVLSRTVWAKNSLLIIVVDEMFSLVKISGKLYKSCIKYSGIYNLPESITIQRSLPYQVFITISEQWLKSQ